MPKDKVAGMDKKPNTIDEYLIQHPEDVQHLLAEIRSTIQMAAPEATETISYGIPTFKYHGNLVHFAAFKNHIGLYPGPAALIVFQSELTGYKRSKGAVQFPLDQPIPLDLIRRIVLHRVKENAK